MLAEQRLREGRLSDSLALLQDEVRKAPAEAKLRTFLFQLLAVLGQWERALKQLQVAAQLDPTAIPMAQACRELIRAEVFRAEVFAGKRTPLLLGEPADWVASLVQALAYDAEGKAEEADAQRAQALDAAAGSAGELDGDRIAWISDADTRLGPVLETFIRGRYCWVPFACIVELELERPTDLRDLVWLPARITLQDGESQPCFVPARYPNSHASTQDVLRLARATQWEERGPHTLVGLGQRTLLTDLGERPLLESRKLLLDRRVAPGVADA